MWLRVFSASWTTGDEWKVYEAWSNVGYQWWGTVKDRMDTFQLYMWPAHTLQDSCISHHIAFFSQWENIAKTNHFQ